MLSRGLRTGAVIVGTSRSHSRTVSHWARLSFLIGPTVQKNVLHQEGRINHLEPAVVITRCHNTLTNMAAEKHKNLFVSTEWLKGKLDSGSMSGIRLLDCQWHLPSTKRDGAQEYKQKHIPESLFFDLEECRDKTTEIDHMLPKPEDFAKFVGKLGIDNKTHLVLYDNSDNFGLFSAQRVWWTFRVFGHSEDLISIVIGGLPAWIKAGYPTTDVVPKVDPRTYKASYNSHLVKSMDEVRSALKDTTVTVLDARPAPRFEGQAPEPREGVLPGHMPGAQNLPFFNLIDKDRKQFRPTEEVKQQFLAAGIDPSKPLVTTCGSGIAACMLALGAYVCGNDRVAVYDGSWTEWYLKTGPEEKVKVPK